MDFKQVAKQQKNWSVKHYISVLIYGTGNRLFIYFRVHSMRMYFNSNTCYSSRGATTSLLTSRLSEERELDAGPPIGLRWLSTHLNTVSFRHSMVVAIQCHFYVCEQTHNNGAWSTAVVLPSNKKAASY